MLFWLVFIFIVATTASMLPTENNLQSSKHAYVFEQLLWFGMAVMSLYTKLCIPSSGGLCQI